jgi:D-alanine-D-alanine ligase
MNVAIVYGGYSPEWVISEKSAKVVFAHLNSADYPCTLVHIEQNGWFACPVNGERIALDKNDFSFIYNGTKVKFDVVFNAIHGTPGEDGRLQGYLDMLGIPYTSPGVLASAVTFNKSVCNGFLRQYANVNIAASEVIHAHLPYDPKAILARIGLPCFVKPSSAGSSFGISKVKLENEFATAIAKAFEHDNEVVIEQYIQGTEVSCGVYRTNGTTTALAGQRLLPPTIFSTIRPSTKGQVLKLPHRVCRMKKHKAFEKPQLKYSTA